MNVNDFLDHSEQIANDGRPAWVRSAVSRDYYAAHHAAVGFLFQVGVRTPRGGGCHIAAYNALLGIDPALDLLVREAGKNLMELHRKRNRADYDWNDLRLEQQDQAQDSVQLAREFVAVLEDRLADTPRADDLYAYFRAWVPTNGHHLGLTLV